MNLPSGYFLGTGKQLIWVRICAVGVCGHRLDHPITELRQQLEVRFFLQVGEHSHAICFGLFFRLIGEGFKDLGLGGEVRDDIISVTGKKDLPILLIKFVQLVLDFFTPV